MICDRHVDHVTIYSFVFVMSLHLLGGGHIDLVRTPLASAQYSMNHDSYQIFTASLLGDFHFCALSCERVVGFLSDVHGYVIGTLSCLHSIL